MSSVLSLRLTQGLVAIVDAADEETVAAFEWSAHQTKHLWYARAWAGPGRIMLHALLTGWPMTDHINGDGLDNRRENLRPATRSQNMANRRKLTVSGSRFKGVSPFNGKWKAQIGHQGRRVYLGLFMTDIAAALAYDAAARDRFGTYAALNFPLPGERGALGGAA